MRRLAIAMLLDEPIGAFDRLYDQPHAAPCWARAALAR